MSDQASGSKKDQHEKLLQAMIDAAAVSNPTLKERVSIAAAWQFMQLPDDSFGWAGKKDQAGNRPPMPATCKVLCILEALAVGLRPGTGQVIWLGNKPFISADAKRYLANSSRELTYFGEVEYYPPTQDERAMFGLVDGDMAIWVKRQVKFKGEQSVWKGLGIIAKAELDYRDNYGKPRAGMQSKKDAVQTLFTRAENMMLKYNYPVGGLADMPDDPAAYIDVYSQDASDQPVAANVMQIEAAPAVPSMDQRELSNALSCFNRAVTVCEDAGLSPVDVLLSDLDYYRHAEDVELINEATDELIKAADHQISAKRRQVAKDAEQAIAVPVTSMGGAVGGGVPPREPPPAAAAPKPAAAAKPAPAVAAPGAAEVEEKRGRGRPPNKKKPVVVQRIEMTTTEIIRGGPVEPITLPEGYELNSNVLDQAAAEDRAEMAEQEFEEMDRPTVLPEVELSEIPKSALQAAREADIEQQTIRLEKAIKSVKLRGGHLVNICGSNPLNALDSGDPARMEATSQMLEAWSPPAPAPAKAAAKPAPAPEPAAPPAPAPVADSESVRMIDRALAQGPLDPTYVKLVNQLRALPHPKELYMQLPQALRVGKKGDYSYLQALIRSCSK